LPRFAKDDLPNSAVGISVAIADRLDTLVGIFGIGQHPTGDKDPYALRRQALAIIRILIEKQLNLDLNALLKQALAGFGARVKDTTSAIHPFILDRFKAFYLEQGIKPQTLEAVLANPTTPYDMSRRVVAVSHFQTLPEAEHLANANKRVRNILQKSAGFALNGTLPTIDNQLLKEPAEKALFESINQLQTHVAPLIAQGEYQQALTQLASLQQPVDTFFDGVMVMADDEALKNNRIALLAHLAALFYQIADISRLAL